MNGQVELGSTGARSLRPEALERLRRQAVAAVESGLPQSHVARNFGVSRKTVGNWMRAYEAAGESAFRPRRRGRRAGDRLALSTGQQGSLLKEIMSGTPETLGLPSLLWTRRVLGELVRKRFGISLSAGTVDQYLSRWQFSRTGPPARPAGCEPRSLLVTWTRPCSPEDGLHRNALVAVNHRGILFFLGSEHAFTGDQLAEFRQRLCVQLAVDVHLVVQDWPIVHAGVLAQWRDAGWLSPVWRVEAPQL